MSCLGQVPRAEWGTGTEVTDKFKGCLEIYLNKFQDPTASDSMSRLQSDLDDTKIILVSVDTAEVKRILLSLMCLINILSTN